MLAYGRLMQEVFQIDKTSVELFLEKMHKYHVTELRYSILKLLAQESSATISVLLKKAHRPHTGGSHKTITYLFNKLEKEGILRSSLKGTRRYWKYSEQAQNLPRYFRQL